MVKAKRRQAAASDDGVRNCRWPLNSRGSDAVGKRNDTWPFAVACQRAPSWQYVVTRTRRLGFVFAKSGDFCGFFASKCRKLANKAHQRGALLNSYALCFQPLLSFVSTIVFCALLFSIRYRLRSYYFLFFRVGLSPLAGTLWLFRLPSDRPGVAWRHDVPFGNRFRLP